MPQVAPFPYFGGKRRVAVEAWARFGDAKNYVEPFFGSGAVLLHRDTPVKTETVNDLDGLLCNFWRAVRADPKGVAAAADWPVSEADLHPRHLWLVRQRDDITTRLQANAEWYDVKAAGWWVWGACAWIGSGWASGEGPWAVDDDGEWFKLGNRGRGINRKLPHLGNRGRGINRQLPHLGNRGQGINRQLPHLGDRGRGINRQLPHLGDRGQVIAATMRALQARLRDTRIACGSWERVLSPAVTWRHGLTAVLLDPPYDEGAIDYSVGNRCAADVRAWAIEHGDNPRLRIALCGYDEHNELESHGWTPHRWKASGGYGSQSNGQGLANSARETVWFSPHCLAAADDSAQAQQEIAV